MKELIQKLEQERILSEQEYLRFFREHTEEDLEYLFERARAAARSYYGTEVYTRGLIEFTNYCKNNCYYCGIRAANTLAERYRLTETDILACCQSGYELGFRTFVLQGGEDPCYPPSRMVAVIRKIRESYPDCAITLSIGEQTPEVYQAFFDAGANRFLLRHETADETHYKQLHPESMKLSERMNCLRTLKKIGYQTGTGFMVGSPYQTDEAIVKDLYFLKELQPHMIGIGPYIPHKQTPFHDKAAGTLEQTLMLLGILRLMFPHILLPATTALGTIDPLGREKGILAGANVVMPNLSPVSVRAKYALYDNKICTGDEAAECRHCLSARMNRIGYQLVTARGDCKSPRD